MSSETLNLTQSNLPDWLDPFPEPQTIPGGWNVENIVPGHAQRAADPASESAEAQAMHRDDSLTLHA